MEKLTKVKGMKKANGKTMAARVALKKKVATIAASTYDVNQKTRLTMSNAVKD